MTDKRNRFLRKQRDRIARMGESTSQSPADMRFACAICDTRFTVPGNVMAGGVQLTNASTGEVFDVPLTGWQAPCPVCGQKAKA